MELQKEVIDAIKVHLVQGIFIAKTTYDSCWVLSKSGSTFVKNIAVAVFGVETLMNSSVTGRQGNRINKGLRPGLDPTKLQSLKVSGNNWVHSTEAKHLKSSDNRRDNNKQDQGERESENEEADVKAHECDEETMDKIE